MAFNWFKKLKNGLSKSATKVENAFTSIVGKKTLDDQTLNDLEEQLIMADLGLKPSSQIVEKLKSQKFSIEKDQKEISKNKVFKIVANEISNILKPCEKNLFQKQNDVPYVILLSGVNGSGKTTTAGKIAENLKKYGSSSDNSQPPPISVFVPVSDHTFHCLFCGRSGR